jgi:O-antigen/teichoic acid export membrane protein
MPHNLANFLDKLSPSLRKIMTNIGWLTVEKILGMAVSLFVGVYVIRYLGADDFGKLSYSLSLVGLLEAVAKLGLDSIVIRNLVKEEEKLEEILGTAFLIKLVASLLGMICLIGLSLKIDGYSQSSLITAIAAFSLLCGSIDVIDYWFQARVQSRSMAIIRSFQLIFSSSLKLVFIAFAWLFSIDYLIRAIGSILVYNQKYRSIFAWKFSWDKAVNLLKDSLPLMLSSVMVTIYMKIDQVMLEKMASSQEVGYYVAAIRFSEIWYFIPIVICSSVFPSIVKARGASRKQYYAKLQYLYDTMAWISLVIALIVTFLAEPCISLLLGAEYSKTSTILTWHIWAAPFVFLGVANHQWLISENFTRFCFATTSLGAITNIIINFFLSPKYGGIGAAIATVIAYGVSSHISCLFYPPMYRVAWMLTKALFIPFRFHQNVIYFSQIRKKLLLKAN